MNSPPAEDIVLGARIREVVKLGPVLDTLLDKTEAVLPNHRVVDGALADKKLALEITGVFDEARLLETLGVRLRSVHVPEIRQQILADHH